MIWINENRLKIYKIEKLKRLLYILCRLRKIYKKDVIHFITNYNNNNNNNNNNNDIES